jgi:cytochrome c oxidase subunit IV
MADIAHQSDNGEIAKPQTKAIWRTFFILLGITAIEFLLAFTMASGGLRTSIFIIMTLLKAFYIVADFMHLKQEAKGLVFAIVLPLLFVIWLVGALIYEGGSIYQFVHHFKS